MDHYGQSQNNSSKFQYATPKHGSGGNELVEVSVLFNAREQHSAALVHHNLYPSHQARKAAAINLPNLNLVGGRH